MVSIKSKQPTRCVGNRSAVVAAVVAALRVVFRITKLCNDASCSTQHQQFAASHYKMHSYSYTLAASGELSCCTRCCRQPMSCSVIFCCRRGTATSIWACVQSPVLSWATAWVGAIAGASCPVVVGVTGALLQVTTGRNGQVACAVRITADSSVLTSAHANCAQFPPCVLRQRTCGQILIGGEANVFSSSSGRRGVTQKDNPQQPHCLRTHDTDSVCWHCTDMDH